MNRGTPDTYMRKRTCVTRKENAAKHRRRPQQTMRISPFFVWQVGSASDVPYPFAGLMRGRGARGGQGNGEGLTGRGGWRTSSPVTVLIVQSVRTISTVQAASVFSWGHWLGRSRSRIFSAVCPLPTGTNRISTSFFCTRIAISPWTLLPRIRLPGARREMLLT